MASLQGYLMGYKVRPVEAVEDAPAWVEKERMERRSGTRRRRGKCESGLSALHQLIIYVSKSHRSVFAEFGFFFYIRLLDSDRSNFDREP